MSVELSVNLQNTNKTLCFIPNAEKIPEPAQQAQFAPLKGFVYVWYTYPNTDFKFCCFVKFVTKKLTLRVFTKNIVFLD